MMSQGISRELFDQIAALLHAGGKSFGTIAKETGSNYPLVRTIARGQHFYQIGRKARKPKASKKSLFPNIKQLGHFDRRGQYTPPPEEIANACELIRATWTEERVEGWQPPVFSSDYLEAA